MGAVLYLGTHPRAHGVRQKHKELEERERNIEDLRTRLMEAQLRQAEDLPGYEEVKEVVEEPMP